MPSCDTASVARESVAEALVRIEACEQELADLDAVAGDGDHGAGMVRGLSAAAEAAAGESAAAVLTNAGNAFVDAAGGASGVLYGMAIVAAGQALPEARSITASDVHEALAASCETICRLGKAKPGDKTMIDTLHPFAEEFDRQARVASGIGSAWNEALVAARAGAAATADMVATRGRSSKLGERSRGTPDPGAMSMLYVLEAFGDVLNRPDSAT